MKRHTDYSYKLDKFIHAAALLISMALIMCLLGWMLAGREGMLLAIGASAFLAIFGPRFSLNLVLRGMRARPINPYAYPQLTELVRILACRAGLAEQPVLFTHPQKTMNAFAMMGREGAAIVLSERLLNALSTRELAGIIGHEMAHIRNNDLQLMGLADIVQRVTRAISLIGQLSILVALPAVLTGDLRISVVPVAILVFAPSLCLLLQLALSRTREFAADRGAVELTGDALGLASALHKLEVYHHRLWQRLLIPAWQQPQSTLLLTHPPTRERLKRLLELAGNGTATITDSLSAPSGLFTSGYSGRFMRMV